MQTSTTSISPSVSVFLEEYVCQWLNNQDIRKDLINRITYKKTTNVYDKCKMVNDDALAEEYYQVWIEQPANKPMLKLAMHPLLTKQDQKIIDDYSIEERNHQIKTSMGLTAGTVAFYWLFLSRMAKFQRFFNNRNRSRLLNGSKKFIAFYIVLISWQASLSSHYEKKVPKGLHEKGLFKKYNLQFEQKNV